MSKMIQKLQEHRSATPSRWKEEVAFRVANKHWLRYSQDIAMIMLDRMEELGLTPQALAEKMGCRQQYVSKILQGRENLSTETLNKIQSALKISLPPQLLEAL